MQLLLPYLRVMRPLAVLCAAALAATGDDLYDEILRRLAQARALAGLGRLDEAAPHARAAADLAGATDFLNMQADEIGRAHV